MRVATQNYWHVSGPSPKKKNRILADFCRDNKIDILCIQEGIGGLGNIIYGTTDSIRSLAKMLGYHYYEIECFPHPSWPAWLSHYSSGIISRRPPKKNYILSICQRKHPLVMIGDVLVCNFHINPLKSTAYQIRELTATIAEMDNVIMAGDFNNPKAPEIVAEQMNITVLPETGQIDFILWKGYATGKTYMVDLQISDHPLVWAELG